MRHANLRPGPWPSPMRRGQWRGLLLGGLCALFTAGGAWAASAQELRATYQQMQGALASSPLRRPILLSSTETPDGLKGDVHAVINQPLASLSAAFGSAANWCGALLLHLNNRDCTVSRDGGAELITLSVVRKFDQPVDDAFRLPFSYRLVARSADYFEATLTAGEGPLGTSNYLIVLEAIALDARRSFLHFSYKYDDGTVARKATQAYLHTFGRKKVGFAITGQLPNGEPEYVRGTAGLVERNAMRYFLAVDAYLGGGGPVPGDDAQAVARQKAWFAATERYPKQLHETDLATYLALKRSDVQRRSKPAAK